MGKLRFWVLAGVAACGIAVACVLALPWLTRFSASSEEYAAIADGLKNDSQRGIAYFAFGDFSALSTDTLRVSATPWKFATAALALDAVKGDVDRVAGVDISAVFRRFGFHSPQAIGNWPADMAQPHIVTPLGQNVGLVGALSRRSAQPSPTSAARLATAA